MDHTIASFPQITRRPCNGESFPTRTTAANAHAVTSGNEATVAVDPDPVSRSSAPKCVALPVSDVVGEQQQATLRLEDVNTEPAPAIDEMRKKEHRAADIAS